MMPLKVQSFRIIVGVICLSTTTVSATLPFLCRFRLFLRFKFCKKQNKPSSSSFLTIVGRSTTSFHPVGGNLCFQMNNGILLDDKSKVSVQINTTKASITSLNQTSFCTEEGVLGADLNIINVTAYDTKSKQSRKLDVSIWAGSYRATVMLVNKTGSKYEGFVNVTAELSRNTSVQAWQTTTNGTLSFENLPDQMIFLFGVTDKNEIGTVATRKSDDNVTMVLAGLGTVSTIDNNDFTFGTAGWEDSSGVVTLVEHTEDSGPPYSFTTSLLSTTNKFEPLAADGDLSSFLNPDIEVCTNAVYNNTRSVHRTFATTKGVNLIHAKYRFVTAEFPTWFGSRYNDYFRISLRTQTSVVQEGNSMNGLGRDAFDEKGATRWKSIWLNVNPSGDTVSIDASVANVGDGLFDSCVYIDFVQPWECDDSVLKSIITNVDNIAGGVLNSRLSDLYGAAMYLYNEADEVARILELCGETIESPRNAFVHCYWSCRMAQNLGPDVAAIVGSITDACTNDTNPHNHLMDTFNDRVGRERGLPGVNCRNSCREALSTGKLKFEDC